MQSKLKARSKSYEVYTYSLDSISWFHENQDKNTSFRAYFWLDFIKHLPRFLAKYVDFKTEKNGALRSQAKLDLTDCKDNF